jgi:hypothetical protein
MQERVGRNDPCPCGSGKKFKKCHGADNGPEPQDSFDRVRTGPQKS